MDAARQVTSPGGGLEGAFPPDAFWSVGGVQRVLGIPFILYGAWSALPTDMLHLQALSLASLGWLGCLHWVSKPTSLQAL